MQWKIVNSTNDLHSDEICPTFFHNGSNPEVQSHFSSLNKQKTIEIS